MSQVLISRDEMIAEQKRIFDSLRSGSEVCFLIKHEAHSEKFAVVRQIESGFFVSYDHKREAFLLRVATADVDFAEQAGDASFIAHGTPDADGDIFVYPMPEDKRDKVPPNESSPCWRFFAERAEKERFRVPE